MKILAIQLIGTILILESCSPSPRLKEGFYGLNDKDLRRWKDAERVIDNADLVIDYDDGNMFGVAAAKHDITQPDRKIFSEDELKKYISKQKDKDLIVVQLTKRNKSYNHLKITGLLRAQGCKRVIVTAFHSAGLYIISDDTYAE